jgi:hypothetical protein
LRDIKTSSAGSERASYALHDERNDSGRDESPYVQLRGLYERVGFAKLQDEMLERQVGPSCEENGGNDQEDDLDFNADS